MGPTVCHRVPTAAKPRHLSHITATAITHTDGCKEEDADVTGPDLRIRGLRWGVCYCYVCCAEECTFPTRPYPASTIYTTVSLRTRAHTRSQSTHRHSPPTAAPIHAERQRHGAQAVSLIACTCGTWSSTIQNNCGMTDLPIVCILLASWCV
jgi:hypothetical protein